MLNKNKLLSHPMIFKFAWRYFKGKKSTQAIQIISWVSVMAMAIGTAALIIVLSVFNGFEFFIKNLYTNFYPDIKIIASHGKYFDNDSILFKEIKNIKGIKFVSKSLEEKVLFTFDENQAIVTLKGIDNLYDSVTNFNRQIEAGTFSIDEQDQIPSIALGLGVANKLGVSEESHFPINCYSFKKDAIFSIDPTQAYNSQLFMVNALYILQEDIDNNYTFTALKNVQELSENNKLSSIEIKLEKSIDAEEVQKNLKNILAKNNLISLNRYEQNKTLFFILKSERWVVYAILCMMLLIASFNIIGSLSMLVIDKEKDIAILKTMGMKNSMIKKIFVSTGILISLVGAFFGCVLAYTICIIQIKFGIIKLGGGDAFLVDAYPVKILFSDFILVMLTVVCIAILASYIPSLKASKKPLKLNVR